MSHPRRFPEHERPCLRRLRRDAVRGNCLIAFATFLVPIAKGQCAGDSRMMQWSATYRGGCPVARRDSAPHVTALASPIDRGSVDMREPHIPDRAIARGMDSGNIARYKQ